MAVPLSCRANAVTIRPLASGKKPPKVSLPSPRPTLVAHRINPLMSALHVRGDVDPGIGTGFPTIRRRRRRSPSRPNPLRCIRWRPAAMHRSRSSVCSGTSRSGCLRGPASPKVASVWSATRTFCPSPAMCSFYGAAPPDTVGPVMCANLIGATQSCERWRALRRVAAGTLIRGSTGVSSGGPAMGMRSCVHDAAAFEDDTGWGLLTEPDTARPMGMKA